MTDSAFVATSRILAEQANSFDLLRIIAADNRKLTGQDRETLITAADELEAAQRALVLTHLQLLETQQKLIAVNDQLLTARRAFPSLRMCLSNGVANG